MSTTRTPIRALQSSVSLRTSPSSVPPASSSYEPQVAQVVQTRLSNVVAYSMLVSLGVSFGWGVWQRGGLGGMVLCVIWTIVGGLGMWAVADVPVLVGRYKWMSGERTLAPSPRLTFKAALNKKTTRPAFVAYTASAVGFAVLHAVLASIIEGPAEAKLGLFVKSRKHPYYINPRLVFLLISQFGVGCTYLFRNLLKDRFAFPYTHRSAPPPYITLLLSTIVSVATASTSLPLTCLAFAVVRMVVVPLALWTPLLGNLLRVVGGHWVRGGWTFTLPLTHTSLLTRAWFLAATTAFLWESCDSFFDTAIAEPVHLTSKTNGLSLLISGLTSSSPITKFRALTELQNVLTGSSARSKSERQVLFAGDVSVKGTGTAPNLWAVLVNECLAILRDEVDTVKRRGKPKPASPAKPLPKIDAKSALDGLEERVHATPTPLLRTSILRSAPSAASTTPKASPPPMAPFEGVPDLFKSVASTPAAAATANLGQSIFRPAVHTVKSIEKKVVEVKPSKPATSIVCATVDKIRVATLKVACDAFTRYAPEVVREGVEDFVQDVKEWWERERVDRGVECILGGSGMGLGGMVVDVLATLIAYSLTEDLYGTVQRDIPRVLEAIVEAVGVVDEVRGEVEKKWAGVLGAPGKAPAAPESNAAQDDADDASTRVNPQMSTGSLGSAAGEDARERERRRVLREEVDCAQEALDNVVAAYKTALARIARTFGPKLDALKVSPRVRTAVRECVVVA